MAKEYGYYIEGNKLGIVERDTSFDNNVDSKEFGPGVARRQWKSPLTGISKGLEIKYAHSPEYIIPATTIDVNKFMVNGWTVINGYLTFLRQDYSASAAGSHINWTGAPYSLSDGDYIKVSNSDRWNGIHKVQINASYPGTESAITTTTRTNSRFPYWENQDIDTNTNEEIFDGGTNALHLANYFSAGDYIWLSGFESEQACGLWRVGSVTISDTHIESKITVDAKYFVQTSVQPLASFETDDGYPLNEEIVLTGSALMTPNSGEADINLYGAQRDFCDITTGVDVLNDEADELNIPSYLEKALVYYVKGRLAEDAGNIEVKEYMMREYKKHIEEYETSLVRGPRIISSGYHAIR